MTFVCAAVAAGAFSIGVILIGITQHIIGKRLSDIQAELGELQVEVSRLFVLALNANPKADAPQAEPNTASAESVGGEVATPPSPALEIELVEVPELCAKLITLVPPAEAAPLLRDQGLSEGPVNWIEGRKRLPPGPLGYPSLKVVVDWLGRPVRR
jgi:hypothetical protein